MSRIGKKAVAIPAGVTATRNGNELSVKGPKGTLSMPLSELITYDVQSDSIGVQPANDTKRARAFWGMQRTLVQNLVTGVTEGFTKKLLITGVGYRAAAQGKTLKLQLGYSHDVNIDVPEGIEVKTPDATTVEISGAIADAGDEQLLGEAVGDARHQVLHHRALHAPEGAGALGVVGRLHRNAAVFERVADLVTQRHGEGALGALHADDAVVDRRGHASRYGDRLLTDAAHQNTSASTSPPTFCSRASASERTPRGVETMVMPRPLRTRGSSCEPE